MISMVSCALMLGTQSLFLLQGKWIPAGQGIGDKNFGSLVVVCLKLLIVVPILTNWLIDMNQIYMEQQTINLLGFLVAFLLVAVLVILDAAILRKQHSLRRRGIFLVILILLVITTWVIGYFAKTDQYGGHSGRLFDALRNEKESFIHLTQFVYPAIWLFLPIGFLLWKSAQAEDEAAEAADPFIDPNEPKQRKTAQQPLPAQDRQALQRKAARK